MPIPPVLFSRLESNADVDISVVGVGGARTGTVSYAAGKFGNGCNGNSTSNYIRWTAAVPDIAKFTHEEWVKPALDSASGTRYQFLRENTGGLIDFFHNNGTDIINCQIYSPGPTYSPNAVYHFNGVSWAAGELFHIAFVCDSTAAAGSKIIVYKNGTPYTATSYSEGGGGVWNGTNYNVELGGTQNTSGVIDNLKIYGYIKTDFSDREFERAGMNDQY